MPEIASAKLSIDTGLLRPGARVLDVGCGDGRHVRAVVERGCRAVGVDYDADELRRTHAAMISSDHGLTETQAARAESPRHGGTTPSADVARAESPRHGGTTLSVDAARAEGPRHGGKTVPAGAVDLLVADAAHLPFRAASFDAVICTETLEHLPDDVSAMRELSAALRCGGLLLAAVPSHFTESIYFALSRGYREAPGGHLRIYAPAALLRRLRGAGFAARSVRFLHFIDSLLWLRFCLRDATQRRPRTGFEAAVMLAVAQQHTTPAWRLALRRGIARSRFIAMLDTLGACIWPKSFVVVAEKRIDAPDQPEAHRRTDAAREVASPPVLATRRRR